MKKEAKFYMWDWQAASAKVALSSNTQDGGGQLNKNIPATLKELLEHCEEHDDSGVAIVWEVAVKPIKKFKVEQPKVPKLTITEVK